MNAISLSEPTPSPDLSPGELLSRVEAFLQRHEMADTRFGRDVTDDPNLVDSLRGGREPRRAMRIKIVTYMASKDAELAGSDHADEAIAAADDLSPGNADQLSASVTSAAA